MDIFFSDPNDVPVPPDEVKIRDLTAQPHPDGRKVVVKFEITPFQKSPNVEIDILNQNGEQVSTLSIIEAIENKMTFTMHFRETNPEGRYTVKMRVFYANLDDFEEKDGETPSVGELLEQIGQTVDTAKTSFEIKPGETSSQ